MLQKRPSYLISLFSAVKLQDYFLLCVCLGSAGISAPCLSLRATGQGVPSLREHQDREERGTACTGCKSFLPDVGDVTFPQISLQIK